MARRPRSDLSGFPLHVIQRGNNRSACFFSDRDRTFYLHCLGAYAATLEVQIHAWVLMTNHVHLLITPRLPSDASRLMQALGRRYVRYFNDAHERSGTLWEGRYGACAVQADDYFLACMRYIERNPVRAGLADLPEGYRWSSYRANAMGHEDALLTEHLLYTGLGESVQARRSAYRGLFESELAGSTLAEIRSATASGHLLAGQAFRKEMERARGLTLGPATRGRPRKVRGTESDVPIHEPKPLIRP